MGPCVSKNSKPTSQKKDEDKQTLAPENNKQKISEEFLASQKDN